jgi:hypothetical protein
MTPKPDPIEKIISGDRHASKALMQLVSLGCDRGEVLQRLDFIRGSGPDSPFPKPIWERLSGKTPKAAKAFPERVGRMGKEIARWQRTGPPEFWLRVLHPELNLVDVMLLATKFRSLPDLLPAYADHVKQMIAQGAMREWAKAGREAARAQITELITYVTKATGAKKFKHYEAIADLLAPLGIAVSPDDLRQYPHRHPWHA